MRAHRIPLLFANTTGVCCGIAFSFVFNRGLTFKVLDRVSDRFSRFVTVTLAGLAASNALVYALTLMSMRDLTAKVLIIFLVAGTCQFAANRICTLPEPLQSVGT